MGLPELSKAGEKATEALEDVTRRVKARLSILPDKKRCPECYAVMEATRIYDKHQAAFYAEYNGTVPAYECPECGYAEYREEHSVTAGPFDR